MKMVTASWYIERYFSMCPQCDPSKIILLSLFVFFFPECTMCNIYSAREGLIFRNDKTQVLNPLLFKGFSYGFGQKLNLWHFRKYNSSSKAYRFQLLWKGGGGGV